MVLNEQNCSRFETVDDLLDHLPSTACVVSGYSPEADCCEVRITFERQVLVRGKPVRSSVGVVEFVKHGKGFHEHLTT